MVVLFDIAHPAQKHFYNHIIFSLQKAGHQTLMKDFIYALLHHYRFRVISVMQSGRNIRITQMKAKINRDWVK
jgi:predicted glycosyltransferase